MRIASISPSLILSRTVPGDRPRIQAISWVERWSFTVNPRRRQAPLAFPVLGLRLGFGREPFRPADVARLDERRLAVAVLPSGLELDLVRLAEEPEQRRCSRIRSARPTRPSTRSSAAAGGRAPRRGCAAAPGSCTRSRPRRSRHRAPHRTPWRGHERYRCPSRSPLGEAPSAARCGDDGVRPAPRSVAGTREQAPTADPDSPARGFTHPRRILRMVTDARPAWAGGAAPGPWMALLVLPLIGLALLLAVPDAGPAVGAPAEPLLDRAGAAPR